MRTVRVVNRRSGEEIGDRVRVTDGFFSRLRGLLGRPRPRPGEGLLITPSRGVHMYGMRYPLDVLILDSDRRVVADYPGLAPGRRTAMHKAGRHALELPTGTIEVSGTRPGDPLAWVPTTDSTEADTPTGRTPVRGAAETPVAPNRGDEPDA